MENIFSWLMKYKDCFTGRVPMETTEMISNFNRDIWTESIFNSRRPSNGRPAKKLKKDNLLDLSTGSNPGIGFPIPLSRREMRTTRSWGQSVRPIGKRLYLFELRHIRCNFINCLTIHVVWIHIASLHFAQNDQKGHFSNVEYSSPKKQQYNYLALKINIKLCK